MVPAVFRTAILMGCLVGCCPWVLAAYYEQYEEVMGTVASVRIIHRNAAKSQRAAGQAFQEIRRVDDVFSLWKEGNEISRVNRLSSNQEIRISPMMSEMICLSREAYRDSGGAFDPTILSLTRLWRHAFQQNILPSTDDVNKAKDRVGFENVEFHNRMLSFKRSPMGFDFGGIAKGYAVDRAVSVLRRHGIRHFWVSISGDIYAGGMRLTQPWTVGIRHPRREAEVIERLELRNQAVSTSADSEQFMIHNERRYHHVVDPRTGWPVGGVISVTVIAPDSVRADAYSTAFFVMGPDQVSDDLVKSHAMRAIFWLEGSDELVRKEIP